MIYTLQGDYPLLHDDETIEPGDSVEMDDEQAAPLVASGRLVPAKKAPAKKAPAKKAPAKKAPAKKAPAKKVEGTGDDAAEKT